MPCFDTITISSQDEIQSHLSALCPDGVVLEIHIVNATGELNFTTITEVNNIYVIDNPLLELLAFPELQALSNIFINPASSLGVLWLPKLKAKLPLGVTSDDHDSSLVQEWAPAIKTTGALPHGLYGLFADNLVAIRTLVVQSSPFGIFGHHLPNLTGIDYLETDACLMLDNLTEVYELLLTRVHGDYSCVHELPSIKSIGALNVTGPASIRAGPQGFAVNDSLIVGPSPPWYYDHADTNSQGEVTFFMGDVKTVGSDTKIIGNADLPLDFGGLESIGGNLILSNNQNCTVDFGQLSVVTNLSMVDNVDTVLPALLKLENAMNIHLRGYIDT
jgi:hypothetical protein